MSKLKKAKQPKFQGTKITSIVVDELSTTHPGLWADPEPSYKPLQEPVTVTVTNKATRTEEEKVEAFMKLTESFKVNIPALSIKDFMDQAAKGVNGELLDVFNRVRLKCQ